MTNLMAGDVVCIQSKGLNPWLIRLGAFLRGRPAVFSHVLIVSHVDRSGTLWGIEGRPGGVGWVDVNASLRRSRYTLDNSEQPDRTPEDRVKVAKLAASLLGKPYDWSAIVADAMQSLGIPDLWGSREYEEAVAPAHVVCSSFADWLYERVGWANPGLATKTRHTTPGDWGDFIIRKRWADS